MTVKILHSDRMVEITDLDHALAEIDSEDWLWMDIGEATANADLVAEVGEALGLDPIALIDAVNEDDLPKLDDFGDHLLLVLRGLADDMTTYEVDCFVTSNHLVTIHNVESPAITAMWSQCTMQPGLVEGGPDELAARIADVMSRRMALVVESFDERNDELIDAALRADPNLIVDLTAVRQDLAEIRRAVLPQREALDQARRADSHLISDAGSRRFSDAFDVISRAAYGLDAARTALAETLDAYQGSEARMATDVSRVLTIYAAIMLPLTVITGFYGMNFDNLPFLRRTNGWIIAAGLMALVMGLSLGMFVSLGWMRRPTGHETTQALGKGLYEAARTPVVLVASLVQAPVRPVAKGARKALARRPSRKVRDERTP